MRNITELLNKFEELGKELNDLEVQRNLPECADAGLAERQKQRDTAHTYTKGKLAAIRWFLGDTNKL